MIQAVSLIGIVLGVIALMDRRTWSFLAVIAFAWIGTAHADAYLSAANALAARIPIDLIAGLAALACCWNRKETWALAVPALYGVNLVGHGLFWSAYASGHVLWPLYAHALNALFLAQLAALSFPGGQAFARSVRRWPVYTGHVVRWVPVLRAGRYLKAHLSGHDTRSGQ